MSGPIEEIDEQVKAARDSAAGAREALESDEERVGDQDMWDAVNSALYDIDYALAKATWTAKDYLARATEAADEGYDGLVEELVDAHKGLKEFREDISERHPVRELGEWLRGLETKLESGFFDGEGATVEEELRSSAVQGRFDPQGTTYKLAYPCRRH